MDFHRGSGTIVYDPYRGDMKRRTQGWCVVNVDKEITRYFRWWLQYQYHIHLQPPSWDAHISIVRGEKIDTSLSHIWKKYQGRRVDFLYKHVGWYHAKPSGLKDSSENNKGLFYFVEVDCPLMVKIREELKLPVGWPMHLTFGRTYEYEARQPKR